MTIILSFSCAKIIVGSIYNIYICMYVYMYIYNIYIYIYIYIFKFKATKVRNVCRLNESIFIYILYIGLYIYYTL